MKRICIMVIIITLGFISSIQTTLGQSDDTTFYIACTVELYEIAEYNHIELDENGCIARFISELQENLKAEGVELIIENEVTENTQIESYFTAAIHGEPVLQLTIIHPHELSISPILFSHPTPSTTPQYGFWAYDTHIDMVIAPTYTTGLILYELSRYEQAKPYFSQVLEQMETTETTETRDYYDIFALLGNVEIMEGNFTAALEDYENAHKFYRLASEELAPISNIEPYWTNINVVWVEIQLNNSEAAISRLENLELGDSEPYTWRIDFRTRRGQLYALAFDYDNAIADMDAAIDIAEEYNISNEQLAELYALRGEIIFLLYEWDRVLENFNTALELNPDYAPAYFQRGVLYYTMTERENALTDFQHYLVLAPDGEHAAEAQRYIDSIQLELESLGG